MFAHAFFALAYFPGAYFPPVGWSLLPWANRTLTANPSRARGVTGRPPNP